MPYRIRRQKKYGSYYINGYALLFEIETGLRVGELCAVQWSDIGENAIHIHSQQLNTIEPGGKNYFLAPYTKNEKGISEDGRYFPLTRKIKSLLDEIRKKQNDLGIRSNFVFCHEDGEWDQDGCLSHVFESYMSLTGSFHHQQSCVSNVIKLKRIDSDGSICGRQSRYAWSFDRDKPKKLQLRKKGLHRKRQKSA